MTPDARGVGKSAKPSPTPKQPPKGQKAQAAASSAPDKAAPKPKAAQKPATPPKPVAPAVAAKPKPAAPKTTAKPKPKAAAKAVAAPKPAAAPKPKAAAKTEGPAATAPSGPTATATFAFHGRFKRREVALADGDRLVLETDGSIRHVEADGTVKKTWPPDDPDWARHAIRFGLRPERPTAQPAVPRRW